MIDLIQNCYMQLEAYLRAGGVIMLLRDIEGFSTDETSQILNLSPSNVKVRLHRARLYLRDKLKGYFENDE